MKTIRFILGMIAAANLANALPRFAEVVEPTNEYPAAFLPFQPPVGARVSSNNVAEYVRENHPGDTMVFTSHESVTGMVVHANGATATVPVAMDGPQGYATIPETMPDEAYMCWAVSTTSTGAPFMVNTAEAWWVGPDLVAAGETFAVHGRNLRDAWCYIGGQWIEADESNPYRAVFTAPALGNGTHVLHVHNGMGGRYGWSAAETITLRDKVIWDGGTYDVTRFGAKGDGRADDLAAITAAIAAADQSDWATVYFPSGTYLVSGHIDVAGATKLRLAGAGMARTIITPRANYVGKYLVGKRPGPRPETFDFKMRDLTLAANTRGADNIFDVNKGSARLEFERVRFSQLDSDLTSREVDIVDFDLLRGVRVADCEFHATGRVQINGGHQVLIEGCEFFGLNDNNTFIKQGDGREISISDCVFRNHDTSNIDDGFGWAQGRLLNGSNPAGSGGGNVYFGGNRAIDLAPRPGNGNNNSGEFVMFEGENARWRAHPTAATSNTVTLAGVGDRYARYSIRIVAGKGMGQSRVAAAVSDDVITLDRPWRVAPDTASVMVVANNSHRVVVHDNDLEGNDRVLGSTSFATTLASPYGGGWDWMVDGNRCDKLRHGIHPFSIFKNNTANSDPAHVAMPIQFCVWQNNHFSNCYDVINFVSYEKDNAGTMRSDTNYVGQLVRGNTIVNPVREIAHYGETKALNGHAHPLPFVMDKNVIKSRGSKSIQSRGIERKHFKLMGNTRDGRAWE